MPRLEYLTIQAMRRREGGEEGLKFTTDQVTAVLAMDTEGSPGKLKELRINYQDGEDEALALFGTESTDLLKLYFNFINQ